MGVVISMSARWTSSREEGSCNACTRHTNRDGTTDHPVCVIDLRGCSVRVCPVCRQELIRHLEAVGDRITDLKAPIDH